MVKGRLDNKKRNPLGMDYSQTPTLTLRLRVFLLQGLLFDP